MITIAPETDEETHAVGALFARAGGADQLFPGHPVQVVRVRPGAIPAHGAGYGGQGSTIGAEVNWRQVAGLLAGALEDGGADAVSAALATWRASVTRDQQG